MARSGAAHLLFVGHSAQLTGAPRSLLRIVRGVAEAGLAPVDVLLLGGGPMVDEYREAARHVTVLADPLPDEPRARSLAGWVPPVLMRRVHGARRSSAVRRALGHKGLALVFVNSAASAAALSPQLPIAVPLLLRVAEVGASLHQHDTPAFRVLLENAASVYAVSDAGAADLCQLSGAPPDLADRLAFAPGFVDPAEVVPENPMDQRLATRAELGLPIAAAVVGAVGTRDERKGTDLFLDVARRLSGRDSRGGTHFVWVGSAHTAAADRQYRQQVTAAGLEDIVHFVPNTDDVSAYYAAFDVLALPSREDPFPVVVLEAALNGVPTVCFDGAGGAPEFVRAGAGVVVPFGDTEAMAEGIAGLLGDPTRCQAAGGLARERALERHSRDRVLTPILERIRDLLGRSG